MVYVARARLLSAPGKPVPDQYFGGWGSEMLASIESFIDLERTLAWALTTFTSFFSGMFFENVIHFTNSLT